MGSEDFDEVHQVVLYGISANMISLLHTGKYGYVNVAYTTTLGYYVVKCIFEPFKLQYYITMYGQVSKAVELVVKVEYLSIMKSKTNWFCKKKRQ